MQLYVLRNGEDKLVFMRKGEILSDDDFSYTESGNDVTITSYIGSDTDVKVVDKFKHLYMLVRPTEYRVYVLDYNYTNDNGEVVLTKYKGTSTNVDTPIMEEV